MASLEEEHYAMADDDFDHHTNFSESPIIEAQDIDVSLKNQVFYKVLKDIEPNVPVRPEISIIFDSYEIKAIPSQATKLGLMNLYHFVCSLAISKIREGKTEDMKTLFGNTATAFLHAINTFPVKIGSEEKFFAFCPADWHNTWPSNFLAFVKAESELVPLQSFLGTYPMGPDPTGAVGKHFFWGSKIWKIAHENKVEINNHLNKLFVPSVHLKSGNGSYL